MKTTAYFRDVVSLKHPGIEEAWILRVLEAPQGRLKVISSRARCHASQCEHSPDVVAQFLLARVN